MRCHTSPRRRFCRQLRATSRTREKVRIRSSWGYIGLRVFGLQLWLFFESPTIRIALLLGLRHTSSLSCLVLNGISVAVESMRYADYRNVESCVWLSRLLLRLWKRLLRFWVILVLLASRLHRILVIVGLREIVRNWWRQVVWRSGRLCVAMCVGMHLLLLLASVVFLD